jgi:hypothetical protein
MDHIAEQFASLQREQERLNALKRAENRRVKLLQKGERLAAELSVWKQTSPMKKTPSGKDGGIGRKLAEFRRQMHKEGADNPIFQQISKNITDVLETDAWLKSTAPKPCLPKTMVDDTDMMVSLFGRWKEQYEQPEGLIPLPNNTVTLTDEECQRFGCDSPTIDIGRWLFDCCAVQSRFEKLTPLMTRLADCLGYSLDSFRARVALSHAKTENLTMPTEIQDQMHVVRQWKKAIHSRPWPYYREAFRVGDFEHGIGYWLHALIRMSKQQDTFHGSVARFLLDHIINDALDIEEPGWWKDIALSD